MNNSKTNLIACALILAISGCGSDDNSPPVDNKVSTLLGGTWTTDCLGPNVDGEYSIGSDTYIGDTLTFSEVFYGNDASCTNKSLVINSNGKVKLGESYVLTTGETVHNLDYTDAAFTATPKSSGTVTALNSISFCGYTDWVIDVSKDMIGCDLNNDAISDVEANMYDIVEIKETSIRYSADAVTMSVNRATTLDLETVFNKQ